MERISNAIKCVNCQSILNLPVLFPCGHSICKHHTNETNVKNQIKCEKCGRHHMIPEEGFPFIESLAEIIDTQFHAIDLGEAFKKAKKNCENFESLFKRVDLVLADPSFEMNEEIGDMKSEILLKREEVKLQIDQQTDKLISKLDSYLEKYNEQLEGDEFKKKLNNLEEKYKSATTKLNEIKSRFNQIVIDETWWKSTSNEIDNELRQLSENLEDFNRSLFIYSELDELKYEVENFKNSHLDYTKPSNKFVSFLQESKIINTYGLKNELIKVCEFQDKPKWGLLYRGSEKNFNWTEFHAKCDNKSPTLVIVKLNDGCILGGYAKAKWNHSDFPNRTADSEAFLFRLKTNDLESKKYKVEDHKKALFCEQSCGPCFGYQELGLSNDGKFFTRLNSSILDISDPPSKLVFGVRFKLKIFKIAKEIAEVEVYQELLS